MQKKFRSEVPIYFKSIRGFTTRGHHQLQAAVTKKSMVETYTGYVPNYKLSGPGYVEMNGERLYTLSDGKTTSVHTLYKSFYKAGVTGIMVVACLPDAQINSNTQELRKLVNSPNKVNRVDINKVVRAVNMHKKRFNIWEILTSVRGPLGDKLRSKVTYIPTQFANQPSLAPDRIAGGMHNGNPHLFISLYRHVKRYKIRSPVTILYDFTPKTEEEKFLYSVLENANVKATKIDLAKLRVTDISTPAKFAGVLNQVLKKGSSNNSRTKAMDRLMRVYKSLTNSLTKIKVHLLLIAYDPIKV